MVQPKNFRFIKKYLLDLEKDIYPQPEDPGHLARAKDAIDKICSQLPSGLIVLDAGCGQAFTEPIFEEKGYRYIGITLGEDAEIAKDKFNRRVYKGDFNFLWLDDNEVDLIFSRHSLEHSPMPLLTLMEWHRVSSNWLALILPDPSYWGWAGRNHYSVLHIDQIRFLLDRAGWIPIWEEQIQEEFRFLCEKRYDAKSDNL